MLRNFQISRLLLVLTTAIIICTAPVLAQKGGKGGDKGGGGGGGDAQPSSTFTWLGTLGGPFSAPRGINENGDIWGSSSVLVEAEIPPEFGEIEFVFHPFVIWATGPNAGQMVDFQQQLIDEGFIGEFDWATLTGVFQVRIGEINNHGEVACIIEEYVDIYSNEYLNHTCLYTPSFVDPSGNLVPSSLQYIDVNAERIDRAVLNDAGVVASVSTGSLIDGSIGTYQWTPATGRVYLGFFNEPWSINISESMCGPYGDWKYVPGDGYTVVFPNGEYGWHSSVRKINDLNQIGGTYQRSDLSTPNACRIEADGSITLIKMPKNNPSIGWGINNNGDVVGSGRINGGYRPFVYTDEAGVIDVFGSCVNLPDEVASLIEVNGQSDRIQNFDINDPGSIVGSVRFDADDTRAFLVTPDLP